MKISSIYTPEMLINKAIGGIMMDTKELAEKLARYPEIRQRFEELVNLVEEGATSADAAEERVIETLRNLGQESLQSWADSTSQRVSAQTQQNIPKSRKETKKK